MHVCIYTSRVDPVDAGLASNNLQMKRPFRLNRVHTTFDRSSFGADSLSTSSIRVLHNCTMLQRN